MILNFKGRDRKGVRFVSRTIRRVVGVYADHIVVEETTPKTFTRYDVDRLSHVTSRALFLEDGYKGSPART